MNDTKHGAAKRGGFNQEAIEWARTTPIPQTRELKKQFERGFDRPLLRALLKELASRANRDWECWPSTRRLAADCDINQTTVVYLLKTLTALNLIKVSPRKSGSRGSASNSIRLRPDYTAQSPAQPGSYTGVHSSESVTDCAAQSVTDALEQSEVPSEVPVEEPEEEKIASCAFGTATEPQSPVNQAGSQEEDEDQPPIVDKSCAPSPAHSLRELVGPDVYEVLEYSALSLCMKGDPQRLVELWGRVGRALRGVRSRKFNRAMPSVEFQALMRLREQTCLAPLLMVVGMVDLNEPAACPSLVDVADTWGAFLGHLEGVVPDELLQSEWQRWVQTCPAGQASSLLEAAP